MRSRLRARSSFGEAGPFSFLGYCRRMPLRLSWSLTWPDSDRRRDFTARAPTVSPHAFARIYFDAKTPGRAEEWRWVASDGMKVVGSGYAVSKDEAAREAEVVLLGAV